MNDLGKTHHQMLKLLSKRLLENSIFMWSLSITPQLLINDKEKRILLQWRILADTTLIKCPNLASLVMGQTDIVHLLMCCTEKDITSFM